MKYKKILLLLVVVVGILSASLPLLTRIKVVLAEEEVAPTVEIIEIKQKLTHRQEVWIHVLEWCESGAKNTIVNPKDLDGTPSYYNFQWKPSTFKGFSLQYKLIPIERLDTTEELFKEMSVYENQYAIVEQMVFDPAVKWETQFPGCVAKYGRPPKD